MIIAFSANEYIVSKASPDPVISLIAIQKTTGGLADVNPVIFWNLQFQWSLRWEESIHTIIDFGIYDIITLSGIEAIKVMIPELKMIRGIAARHISDL